MSAENKATVRRWIEAFDSRDVTRTVPLLAPNFTMRLPGTETNGIDGWLQLATAYRTGFPDIQSEIEDIIAEDDKVVVRCTARGTHAGEFLGIRPTGRKVAISWMLIARVKDGKIVEAWEQLDQLGLFQTLGSLPPMAATT